MRNPGLRGKRHTLRTHTHWLVVRLEFDATPALCGCGPARRGESSRVWLRRNSRKLTWEVLLKAAWAFTRSGEDGCCREEERKERVTEAWRTHSVFGRRSAVSRGPGRRLNESAGPWGWCRAVAGIGWLLCVTAEGAATCRAGGQLAGLPASRSVSHVARFGITGLECHHLEGELAGAPAPSPNVLPLPF